LFSFNFVMWLKWWSCTHKEDLAKSGYK
jgi:hypothetical protein